MSFMKSEEMGSEGIKEGSDKFERGGKRGGKRKRGRKGKRGHKR